MGRGLTGTLRANTQGYIWQPWFSRINGTLNLSTSRSSSSWSDPSNGGDTSSRSVSVSGNGQLTLLPMSRFPFEAHISQTDSTATTDLSVPVDYTSRNFGFSQRYIMRDADASFGYDRNSQSSDSFGTSHQDSVQMTFSKNLKNQALQLTGNATNNKNDINGDFVRQGGVTLQHSYGVGGPLTVDTMGNISNSEYYLSRSRSDSRLSQVGSQAFWRSETRPLTIVGGARFVTYTSSSFNELIERSAGASMRAANANAGASYDVTQFLHVNGSANINMTEGAERRSVSKSETASVSYSPAPRTLGEFSYNWSTSASASNQNNPDFSARQLSGQVSHSINRGFGPFGFDASEGFSMSRTTSSLSEEPMLSRSIVHSAGLSWSRSAGSGSAYARLSATDSRALDGLKEYFQMLNLQLSGSLQTSSYTSWTGSLTTQATRQGMSGVVFAPNEGGQSTALLNLQGESTTTSSSGSLSYQHSRFFGVRNLRFSSDLRLNSQGLLPIMGSPKDQETAAWESHLTYSIGRTHFRAGMIVARVTLPAYSTGADGKVQITGVSRTNKAIMLSVQRSFGDY